MKKLFILVVVVVLALALSAPTFAQEERWVGADDAPTHPLDCPEGVTPVEMEGMTEEPMAAPEYNGGATEGAPDLAGQPITLIDVPKLIGIGYFNATTLGQHQAAEELGNVT